MVETSTWVLAAVLAYSSGTVAGYVGFAFNLLLVPLLSIVVPVRLAVGTGICVALVVGAMTALRDRQDIKWSAVRMLASGGMVGIVVGATISSRISDSWLRLVVAATTVVFALYLAVARERTSGTVPEWMGPFAGATASTLGALTGMGGVPIVAYMTGTESESARTRVTMAMSAIVTGPVTLVIVLATGSVPVQSVPFGLTLMVPALAGVATGTQLFRRDVGRYPVVVAATLLVSAGAGLLLGWGGP